LTKILQKLRYRAWRAVQKLGLDVYPIDPRNSVQSYLAHVFEVASIDCVWDVGANVGQYASMLRNIGFRGEIISFEPIPVAWEALRHNAISDHKWTVHDRCAVGLNEGESVLNVTSDSVSSSLLSPNDEKSIASTVSVDVKRLDSIIAGISMSPFCLLKLDCQGGEYDIIISAGSKIRNFLYVQMEASIYPLYKGEKTFFELTNLMDSLGFDIAFVYPGITDKQDRMVQAELIFKRR
jgi:FkbM family methyltransferase